MNQLHFLYKLIKTDLLRNIYGTQILKHVEHFKQWLQLVMVSSKSEEITWNSNCCQVLVHMQILEMFSVTQNLITIRTVSWKLSIYRRHQKTKGIEKRIHWERGKTTKNSSKTLKHKGNNETPILRLSLGNGEKMWWDLGSRMFWGKWR